MKAKTYKTVKRTVMVMFDKENPKTVCTSAPMSYGKSISNLIPEKQCGIMTNDSQQMRVNGRTDNDFPQKPDYRSFWGLLR